MLHGIANIDRGTIGQWIRAACHLHLGLELRSIMLRGLDNIGRQKLG